MNRLLLPAMPCRASFLALLFFISAAVTFAAEAKVNFDVPAGDAEHTLRQFSSQSGVTVIFPTKTVRGVSTNAIRGELSTAQALDAMLAGTPLVAVRDPKTGTLTVRRAATIVETEKNVPSRPADAAAAAGGVLKLDTFEVFGSKLINADLPRTRDDVQPYVVFGREQIDTSMATNVEDFIRARLPMNQSSSTVAQAAIGDTSSAINLRGLGVNQTLILLDGRRLPPGAGSSGVTNQADINGIPLGMIERIEVLPSTASGIYGGGATGGVINIITRKDYAGVDVYASYRNPFDTDASNRRIEVNGSFRLEDGKTMLSFNVSRSEGTPLSAQDRGFQTRGRARLLANNPAAFYGTAIPPAGYLPNIRSVNGSNLVLKSQFGGTALNSPITYVPAGYRGTSIDGTQALVANAGQYNLDSANAISGRLANLFSVQTVKSYGLSGRRRFGSKVEVFLDASRLDNRGAAATGPVGLPTMISATAPNNPFTTAIRVVYPAVGVNAHGTSKSMSDRLLAGIVVRLPHEWSVGLDYVWSRSVSSQTSPSALVGDPDGAGPGLSLSTAVGNGVFDVLRDPNAYPFDFGPYLMPQPFTKSYFELHADEITLRSSGPLFNLPAGLAMLSTSVQLRDQRIPNSVFVSASTVVPTSSYSWFPEVSSKEKAYYAELRLPVFGEKTPSQLLRDLEFQVSVRRADNTVQARSNISSISVPSLDGPFPAVTDYFNRDFSATKATVGLKYSPVKDITFRASWGTGYLAPSLTNLGTTSPQVSNRVLTDPKRGNVQTTVSLVELRGGNPNLRPEESESKSVGAIFTPRFIPGFRLSLDYTQIIKTDELSTPPVDLLLAFEDRLPGIIVRAPLAPQDQALGYTGGVIQQIDFRTINIAGKRLTAYDLQADYTWKTASWGEFQSYVVATYQPDFSTTLFPDLPYIQTVGTSEVLKWRGNGGLTWTKGRLSLGWNMQYYHSYLIYSATSAAASIATSILNQGSPTIPAQIYHDVMLSYKWGAQSQGWQRLLDDTQVTVGVQNVLNTRPPVFASTSGGNGGYSFFGDSRLARYTISLRKHF